MQAEIDAATGPRLPQLADKPNLPYCEATLYEVMRLSPVAPTSLPHNTMCDTTVGGYDVPKVRAVISGFIFVQMQSVVFVCEIYTLEFVRVLGCCWCCF